MHTLHSKRSSSQAAGFTMVELILTSILLAIVMGAVVMVGATGRGVYDQSSLSDRVETRAVRALDRIVREMEMLGSGNLLPNPTGAFGADDLTFRVPVGVAAGAPVWSVLMQVELEQEPGEAVDGVDNDGDGLVDEARVVLVRNSGAANEQRTVLANGVMNLLEGETADGADENGNGVIDERGFNVHRVGDLMNVRLSLGGMDDEGNFAVRTVETSFRLRN